MCNILFSIENKCNFPIDKYILDSEIDEVDRVDRVLEVRKNIIIT